MREITLIVHDIRSIHNVGSLLRTADGLGISPVYLTGYTPYPPLPHNDPRLPHLAQKIGRQINKTALGAEDSVDWRQTTELGSLLKRLKAEGYRLAALEQTADATSLPEYQPSDKLVLLLGREVEGIDPIYLSLVDDVIEIPMFGHKESFNVVQAAAMALYHCRTAA